MKSLLILVILLLCSFENIKLKSIESNNAIYSYDTKFLDMTSESKFLNIKTEDTFPTNTSATKHALIIANGIYHKETRWRNISSHNDIDLIKNALETQGFLKRNIGIKKDLTHDEFIKTLTTFKRKLKQGDVVFIHISSHGQQIYDDNKDEKDRYDEAIVPVDAYQEYQVNGYKGDKHIRDDKLGKLFDDIRKVIGDKGNLFVALDACHSGTGTRGYGKVRGILEPLQPKNYQGANIESSSNFNLLSHKTGLAPAVYFYGSSANQLNYEYKLETSEYVGSLSYALSKALIESDKNTSYQGLFDHVRRIMTTIAPKQTPQAEGTLNQKILGGQLVGKKEYFLVTEYKNINNTAFTRLNGGTLQGLYEGSKVAFYDIDGLDRKLKATGKVIKANAISSQVKLDKILNASEAENSWVIISERNYGDMSTNVSINLKEKDLQKKLASITDSIGFILINDASPDLIVESIPNSSNNDNIQIYTKDDYVFWKQKNGSMQENITSIIEQIKRYARVSFIRRLEMKSQELDMSFDFIPLLMKQDGMDRVVDKEIPINNKKNSSGTVVFREGDNTYVNIINHSKKTLYYTLLDIQPDNIINILIPDENYTANDFYLRPGESYKHQIEFYPPFGTEIFKLIASEEPLDLSPILRSKGDETEKKNLNPFELLFRDSFKRSEKLSRGASNSIPKGAVNIYTVAFEIREK